MAVEVVVAISFKKPIAFTKVFKTNGALTVWNISFCQAVLGHLETNVKELCSVKKKKCILKEVIKKCPDLADVVLPLRPYLLGSNKDAVG